MLFLLSQIPALSFLSSIYLRMSIAFMLAFLILLILGKPFIKYLRVKKYGESIREFGPESHLSKKGTPTMGGVLIIFTVLVSTIVAANITNRYILLLMLVTILFAAIGFIDDYKKFTNKNGLSGRYKIVGQITIAIIIWLFVNYLKPGGVIKEIDFSIINPANAKQFIYIGSGLSLIFIALVVMGGSNAVNLTDGLDGLVIMPVVIASAIFATVAYFTGHIIFSEHLKLTYMIGTGEIAVYMMTICGAGLGFLWYNSHPAQIFMGDTGSLALGGILGTVAILLKQELLLFVAGGIFVIEAVSVIIQVGYFKITKKLTGEGKRFFRMAPIHHHFEKKGHHETKVTTRFWIVSIMFGILALVIIKLRGI